MAESSSTERGSDVDMAEETSVYFKKQRTLLFWKVKLENRWFLVEPNGEGS